MRNLSALGQATTPTRSSVPPGLVNQLPMIRVITGVREPLFTTGIKGQRSTEDSSIENQVLSCNIT